MTTIKGGWIISFENPSPGFVHRIKSTLVPISNDDGTVELVNTFTASGDIIFEEKHTAEIVNTLYGSIRDWLMP